MKTLYILDWWMGHWRRSVENLSIMRKVFFYLLCMVLILPSVGMTSLRGFFQMFIDEAQSNHTMPTNSTLSIPNCLAAKDLKYVWLDLFHTVGCHLRQVRCTAYS